MQFGEWLRKKREDEGIEQQKLAEQLGIPKSTLCLYELGKRRRIPVAVVTSVAKRFDVTVEYVARMV